MGKPVKYRTPSLNAVRAFEAAIRRGSLTAAARELHVTPGAVSRHVTLLEAHFDCQLLVREQRGVRPTEKGSAYYQAVAKALEGIDAAGRRLMSQASASSLVVQFYTAFATDWLTPRLDSFRNRHPDIHINLIASKDANDPCPDGVDMAGVLGSSDLSNVHKDFLFEGQFTPVCAPSLLAQHPSLKSPADLHDVTLISVAPQADFWRLWFDAAGTPPPVDGDTQMYESSSLADQAARKGAGMAMGNIVVLADELAAGTLVAPFALSIKPRRPYYLSCRRHRINEPAITAFREWLIGEMHDYLTKHAKLFKRFTTPDVPSNLDSPVALGASPDQDD